MDDDQGTPLRALQARFALLRLEGSWSVIDRRQLDAQKRGTGQGAIEFCKKGHEADLLLRREIESLPIPCSKPHQVIQDFYASPSTHVYTGLAFSPEDKGPSVINFWSPPTATPAKGDWSILRTFIEEVLCSGEEATSNYLLHFLAHMLQRPSEKPGVMIVLLGGQGTGKGMFFKVLNALWGHTTLVVSSVEQVVGKFNAALERAFVVCMDEALFRGDKKNMERLKSMITEGRLQVEQKFQPSRTIESVHRFFAASNSDHFAHIDADDRRLLYVRVSNARQQDHAYFSEIDKAIKDPAIVGAMMHDLLALDLNSFRVQQRPKTPELARQKLLSLAGFERFWFEALSSGEFGRWPQHLVADCEWVESRFVPSEVLLEGWIAQDRNAARFDPPQINDLPAKLRRVCPSAKKDRHSVRAIGQRRGFWVPPLAQARMEFERFLGCPIEWGFGVEPIAPKPEREGVPTADSTPPPGRSHLLRHDGEKGSGGMKVLARVLPPLPPFSQ